MMSLLHRKVAFTLIELMVVISIIGVLAAALYPQVGKYMSRSRDAGRITALVNIGSALDSSRFDYDGKYPDHTGGCVPMTTLVTKKYLVSAIESPSGTGYNEGCGKNGQYAYGNLGIGNILMSTMENPQGGNYSGSTAGFTGVITKTGILNALNTKKGAGKVYVRPTNYILNSAIFMASSSGSCGAVANTCTAGTVSNYVPAATCGGNDTWKCLGSSGSMNANCSAVHVCTTGGDCGGAAGVATYVYPTSGLCTTGTATPNDTVGTDGVFNWSCNGSAGAVACSAARQYTVNFNTYGGTPVANQPVAYGGTATLPSPAPTKGGNVFAGWYSDVVYSSAWNFSTTITGTTTLHAKWTASHTITFSSGAATSGSMSAQAIASGSSANLTSNAFVKTGYTFAGWATGSALPVVYANGQSYMMGSANVTLYAKWSINSYMVTFNSNSGSAVASQNINYNSTATTPTAPTRAGYTFGGWYSDVGLTSVWNFATPITGATTLYAKWTLIPSYSITFNSGAATSGSMSAQAIASGSSANLTSNAFVKTGYTFAGWATGSALPVVYANGQSYMMGSANVTLYAKWISNVCMIGTSVFGATCIVGSGSTTNVASCIGLPSNAAWNTATSITQTWSAGIWLPSEVGTYNTNSSPTECRFQCSSGSWNGSACVISYTVSGSFGANGSGATVNGCGGKTATANGSGNFSFASVSSGTICTDISATRSGYTCTTTTNGPASLSANFTTVAGNCALDACVISETSSIDACIVQ